MTKVVINGMGRIGRAVLKILLDTSELELTGMNDLLPPENLAYLLKYDSVYGRYEKEVKAGENSLIIDGKEYRIVQNEDGFDLLKIQPQETISLIGAFIPYIRRLKTMGNPFSIIEKNTQTLRPDEMKFFKPESEMGSTLEKSDVVIITGTAIVNHTIDSILSCLRSGQRAAIIGPTASILPERFFDRGVQVMAGIRIFDPDRMTVILKQAGSAYHLKECSQKIAWMKN